MRTRHVCSKCGTCACSECFAGKCRICGSTSIPDTEIQVYPGQPWCNAQEDCYKPELKDRDGCLENATPEQRQGIRRVIGWQGRNSLVSIQKEFLSDAIVLQFEHITILVEPDGHSHS